MNEIQAANTPRIVNEGVCHITAINRDVFEPWLAEVDTNLTERFLVLDPIVLERCQIAFDEARAVYTFAKYARERFSKRMLYRVFLLPTAADDSWLCVKCRTRVHNVRGVFDCQTCHYVMRTSYQYGPSTPAA